MGTVSRYAKFIVAVAGVLGVVGSAVADGVVTGGEWSAIASAVVAAVLVFAVPNAPTNGNPK